MKQRLGLALALLKQPDLLILDEPTNGMDPAGMQEVRLLLRSLAEQGVTIFLSSHLLHEMELLCDRVAVIQHGRILTQGAVSELLSTRDVVHKLIDVIDKAARGEAVLHPRVASRVVQELRGAKKEIPNLFTELTERELEVLRLIADGLSNAAIAEKLVISEKTVKVHVSNILSKLHILDRTQAAVFAWQQGLVHRAEESGL